jgi:hypothetical protein
LISHEEDRIRQSIRTPRAAAVAGILFALLLLTSEVLVWLYVPSISTVAPMEVARHSRALALAMNLRPFSGIAFLWFIAVVRNRLGSLEDRFFATVFLGSGLLYVAMMFVGGAVAGATISVLATAPNSLVTSGGYDLARAEIHKITTIYATKMAGVFMISDLHNLYADPSGAALDGNPRIRPGSGPFAERREYQLAWCRVSAVGDADQRIRTYSRTTL